MFDIELTQERHLIRHFMISGLVGCAVGVVIAVGTLLSPLFRAQDLSLVVCPGCFFALMFDVGGPPMPILRITALLFIQFLIYGVVGCVLSFCVQEFRRFSRG